MMTQLRSANPDVEARARELMTRPCNIVADEYLWCVSGQIPGGGGGVLVWCYNEIDAQWVMRLFQQTNAFDLSYGPWQAQTELT